MKEERWMNIGMKKGENVLVCVSNGPGSSVRSGTAIDEEGTAINLVDVQCKGGVG
jgi:hypothetical protein